MPRRTAPAPAQRKQRPSFIPPDSIARTLAIYRRAAKLHRSTASRGLRTVEPTAGLDHEVADREVVKPVEADPEVGVAVAADIALDIVVATDLQVAQPSSGAGEGAVADK